MIVYGDPQYTLSRAEAREGLRPYFARATASDPNAARDLVIALGQLEQAVVDHDPASPAASTIMQATDRAAEYFVAQHLGKNPGPDLLRASHDVAMLALDGSGDLTIKIPEGFAFYAVFPEQYIAATEIYAAQRYTDPTLVVGIRSIGTGLSAIVTAALRAAGFAADRITVRPRGHPWARATALEGPPETRPVIIVDEGPGLSGSSMASVASAFRARGAADITFFPSHRNPPGSAASAETMRIWSETCSIVQPLVEGDLRKNPLLAALRRRTEDLLHSRAEAVTDLSAGRWKDHATAGRDSLLAPQFERSKYLVRCENSRGVLWKFAGLGPGHRLESLVANAAARQNTLAGKGWTSPELGHAFGFIATEWIDAPGLDAYIARISHVDFVPMLARYIADAAKTPLPGEECARAVDRLHQMMQCNFEEAGLSHLLARTEKFLPDISNLAKLPAYGDGRLAPHEWLFREGRPIKTDVWGHDSDHTIIGRQPILWDIAGAIIEWDINDIPLFLRAFEAMAPTERIHVRMEDLSFFLLAHTAFQIGLCTFAHDSRRLAHYRAKAETILDQLV